MSDGLAACLLDRSDGNKTMLRAFSRELLAAAVLRNVMFYFTPYTVNKARRGTCAQLRCAAAQHRVPAPCDMPSLRLTASAWVALLGR